MKTSFIYKHRKFFSVLIYLLAALFLCFEMALQVSPSIMTPQLMKEFSLNANTLGVAAACYFISYTLMQIPVGILYDKYGPRFIIPIAVFLCSAGAWFFSFADTVPILAFGRFIMGIGSAFAFIGVLIVAARWFKSHLFAFLVGTAQLLAAFGALGGSFPLSFMVNSLGWRLSMEVLALAGFALSAICFLLIRESPYHEPLMHTCGPKFSKNLKGVFASPQNWWTALYAFMNWAPVTIFAALWGVPYLVANYAISTTYAAFIVGWIWIGIGVTSPYLGWLSSKIKRRKVLLIICSIIGLISSSFIIYSPPMFPSMSIPLLFLFGSSSAGQILTFALIKDNNKKEVVATGIGLNNMSVVLGGAVYQPLVGYLLASSWEGLMEKGLPVYTLHDYSFALMVIPFCYSICLIASIFGVKETYCKASYPH